MVMPVQAFITVVQGTNLHVEYRLHTYLQMYYFTDIGWFMNQESCLGLLKKSLNVKLYLEKK